MTFDPQHHHRRSIRLSGYDYSLAGAYFVTLCVQHRACPFGAIRGDQVELTDCGRIVAKYWHWLEERHPQVELDGWILMPNHLHGIVVITDDFYRGGSRTAPTAAKSLGRLIGAFKTVSTKNVNLTRDTAGKVLWQRNYYEHIIRNTDELNHIRRYIADNPLQWALDRENPTAAPTGSLPRRARTTMTTLPASSVALGHERRRSEGRPDRPDRYARTVTPFTPPPTASPAL